jgi:hypothetical protein
MSHDGPTQPPAQIHLPYALSHKPCCLAKLQFLGQITSSQLNPTRPSWQTHWPRMHSRGRLAVVVTVQHFVHRTETFAGQALLVVYRQLAGSRLHCRHRESFFRAENGGQCALASHVDQFREAVVYVHGVLAAGYVQLTRINLGEGDEWTRFRSWGCVPATG